MKPGDSLGGVSLEWVLMAGLYWPRPGWKPVAFKVPLAVTSWQFHPPPPLFLVDSSAPFVTGYYFEFLYPEVYKYVHVGVLVRRDPALYSHVGDLIKRDATLYSYVAVLFKPDPSSVLTCWYTSQMYSHVGTLKRDPCPVLTHWCTCQT